MAESSTPKGKGKKDKNKKILIGLGIVVVGIAIWLLMRRKKANNIFLNITNYPATNYAPLSEAQVKSELEKANALVEAKGVDGAITDLQSQVATLEAQGTPESLAVAKLLKDFIADLQLQKANEIRNASMVSTGSGSTTNTGSGSMSIADNSMVNDGTNITTSTTNGMQTSMIDPVLGETKSLTTPSALTLPQLDSSIFNSETYDGLIPQATIDGYLTQANAEVLSNRSTPATVASLLSQSQTLANSSNATDRATSQLLYDMAVTLDVATNPANASKYAVVKDANYWRNYLINFYKINTATPDNTGLANFLYNRWATRGITFTQPLDTDYDNVPNAAAKRRFLTSLITTNGALNVISNIIFNITPSGKLVSNRTPTIRQ